MHKITPCLWFDTEGEEAARLYTSVFPNSRIVDVVRFGAAGPGAVRQATDAPGGAGGDQRGHAAGAALAGGDKKRRRGIFGR